MRNESDFSALVVRALAVPGRGHMRPVIEKELLHYDILFVLEQAGLLEYLTAETVTLLAKARHAVAGDVKETGFRI